MFDVFRWPLNRQIVPGPITVSVIFLRITTKVHKPLLQSVYRISSEILGSEHYHTHHSSAASFLFPVHTGSCLCAWTRRRSL